MALKRKISKDDYGKLSDALKSEYVEKEGAYVLDVDGDEGFEALKTEKQKEAQRRRDAEKKASDLEAELDELKNGAARKTGDVAALEKSWQTKLETEQTTSKAKLDKRQAAIDKLLKDSTAATVAAEISTVPSVMKRAILDRLAVEYGADDEPVLRILDKTGKPSAMSVDDLKTEFRADKEYAPIIRAGSGSGGGAGGSGTSKTLPNTMAGGAGNNSNQPKPLAQLSPRDLAAHIKANKGDA